MKEIRIRVKFVEKDIEIRQSIPTKIEWEIEAFIEALRDLVRKGVPKK